jgi:hypothetical protein
MNQARSQQPVKPLKELGSIAFALTTIVALQASLNPSPNPYGLLGDGSGWNMIGHKFRRARTVSCRQSRPTIG